MINLLPQDVKTARNYARRNLLISHYAGFLLTILLLVIGMYGFGYYTLAATAKSAEKLAAAETAQLASFNSVSKRAEEISSAINTTSSLLKREIKFSMLIQTIGSVMPQGARLTNLTLTNDSTKPLLIEAEVIDEAQAIALKENLLQSAAFEGADIQSIQATRSRSPEGVETVSTTTKIITGLKAVPTGAHR